jgi:hypothetical protein
MLLLHGLSDSELIPGIVFAFGHLYEGVYASYKNNAGSSKTTSLLSVKPISQENSLVTYEFEGHRPVLA